MTRLLLVRHGQSEWNALGLWQGQEDPPLSELGRRQAVHAASLLEQRAGSVTAVVASDLRRANETAELIASAAGLGGVAVDAGLRERYAGPWQGLTRAEIEERWPGWLEERRRPEGYESDESILERALASLDRVVATHPGASVLVVTHGGVVYAIERMLGADWVRLANLEGRWIEAGERGRLHLGDRVVLVSEDELTIPSQL